MDSDSGVVGNKTQAPKNDVRAKELYQNLKKPKVLTGEFWQELVNPLIPADGITEEDLEYFQFFEQKRLLEESGGLPDMRSKDLARFTKERSKLVVTEEQTLTLKIPRPVQAKSSREVLRRVVKVHKKEGDPSKRMKAAETQ